MVHLYMVLGYFVTGFMVMLYFIHDAYKGGFRRVLNPLALMLWLVVWILWPFALFVIVDEKEM